MFVTWTDTTIFFIDTPSHTIVDLEDVTDKFAIGLSFLKVLVVAVRKDRIDTIAKGDYAKPVTTKFKVKIGF